MDWDGQERRKPINFCEGHSETREAIILLQSNLSHLTEAVNRIDKHLENASKARVNWWLAISSIVAGVIIQTFVFSHHLGTLSKQVEINTHRLDKIEELLFYEAKLSGKNS